MRDRPFPQSLRSCGLLECSSTNRFIAMNDKTYILTAELDDASFAWLDALRREHFPPERNVLSAHLTMFHRLSAPQIERLQDATMPAGPLALSFDSLRFLGSGVAVNVRSPDLERLRRDIASAIGGELSRQDSQKWTPHVTVQNKVPADTAKVLFAALGEDFAVRSGEATGILVWQYLGGPWTLERRVSFKPQDRDWCGG
jgi:2'-5' RNA ligase